VAVDPLQHVHQVGTGVNLAQEAALDQGVENGRVASADLGHVEHPVLATYSLGPEGPLDVIGIQRDGGILKTDLELSLPGQGISGSLQESVGRKQAPPIDLLLQEIEDLLHDRPGVCLADFEQSLRISPTEPLHQVEPSNPVQDLLICIRLRPRAHSRRCRSLIPREADQPFQTKTAYRHS
jgi:hypothetical protein